MKLPSLTFLSFYFNLHFLQILHSFRIVVATNREMGKVIKKYSYFVSSLNLDPKINILYQVMKAILLILDQHYINNILFNEKNSY